ncbi:MAG: hypothetical protein AAF483_03530 [Planctomycetota bacterium]
MTRMVVIALLLMFGVLIPFVNVLNRKRIEERKERWKNIMDERPRLEDFEDQVIEPGQTQQASGSTSDD